MTLPAIMLASATKPAGTSERRPQDDAAPGQTFSEVVVGVAEQAQGDARGQEGAETLPGRAGQFEVDGARRAGPLPP